MQMYAKCPHDYVISGLQEKPYYPGNHASQMNSHYVELKMLGSLFQTSSLKFARSASGAGNAFYIMIIGRVVELKVTYPIPL